MKMFYKNLRQLFKTQKCNCFHHPSHWYTSGKRGWKTLLIKPLNSYANQSLIKTQFYGTSSVLLEYQTRILPANLEA